MTQEASGDETPPVTAESPPSPTATEIPETDTTAATPARRSAQPPAWLPYFVLAVFPALIIGLLVYALRDGSGGGGGSDRAAGVVDGFIRLGPSEGERIDSYKEQTPPGFPGALPVYPGAKVVVSFLISGDDGASYFVIYNTADAIENVLKYYEERLDKEPWQIELAHKGGEFSGLRFSRPDDADVQGDVSIHASDLDKQTAIYVSYQDVTPERGSLPPKEFVPKQSLALPNGFPDVPIYKGRAESIVTETQLARGGGGTQYLVTFITKNSQDDVISYYRNEFSKRGWTVTDSERAQRFAIAIDFTGGNNKELQGSIITDSFEEDASYTKVDLLLQVSRSTPGRGN